MNKLVSILAKLISESGDLQGATWRQLWQIQDLERVIKQWAKSCVPREKKGTIATDEAYYENRFIRQAHNQCRKETLKNMEKEK